MIDSSKKFNSRLLEIECPMYEFLKYDVDMSFNRILQVTNHFLIFMFDKTS